MTDGDCPFCRIASDQIIHRIGVAIAIWDKFPVAKHHALVIPQRHVASVYDLREEDQCELWRLVAWVHGDLTRRFKPDGFNIGVNDGVAGGQTVLHAHIHIIPRYFGDVDDPRGGIRWVIGNKAVYWESL